VRVYVFPADTAGCGYYRLIWPAQHLREQGYDVKLVHPDQRNKIQGISDDKNPDRLIDIGIPGDADVIVFQRVSSVKMISGIELIRKRGIAVVLDIDDDMKALHPANPVANALNPSTKGQQADYSWNNADKVYAAATLVTASTNALADRYRPRTGAAITLRNCVHEHVTTIEHNEWPNTVGWGGSLHSHPDDPFVVGGAMSRIQREGFSFRIIGPGYGCKQAFALNEEPPSTGPLELNRWPYALARLAVGIAPLKPTRFNEAKSWLKPLEYAAAGVPCVSTPTTEYRRLHALGVGFLADTPRDWYRRTRALLDDDNLRSEMSAAGREVAKTMTIQRHAWRWMEAWTKALEIERGPTGLRSAVPTTRAAQQK
jgi:hypothetical protein